jgi:hypothetical protein
MILRVKTTTGKYEVPVKNKLEAKDFLLTLHRMGITCIRWDYINKEVKKECLHIG